VYTWSSAKYNTSKVNPIVGTKESIKASIGKDTLVFYASVKDSVGCVGKDSIIVFPVPTPIYNKVIDTTLCTGLSVVLDATPKNIKSKRITYLWTPNGDTTATKSVLIPTLNKIDTTNHIVKLTLGECTVSDTATIIGISIPALNLPDALYFCSDKEENPTNQTVVLDANTSGKVKWSTGDSTRTITVNKEGYYKLTVTNNKICTASDSVLVVEKCKPRVYIPTAFSPNGDNKNDVFRVFGNKFVKNFKIIVFNRWGEIIFFLEDIEGNSVFEDANKVYSWDGDYRGDQMPIGPYPYIVTYEGKEEEFKGPYKIPGSVTIIR
jgi:gliding motility-associated-like protein